MTHTQFDIQTVDHRDTQTLHALAKSLGCPLPQASDVAHARTFIETRLAPETNMPFSGYMDKALYDPTYGYYNRAHPVVGAQGDFITAPTLSPILSYCLVQMIRDQRDALGKDYAIVEFGAGDGTLTKQLLTLLADESYLPNTYYIIETASGRAVEQQTALMPCADEFGVEIKWLTDLTALPNNLKAWVIGNEVLDAFPCEMMRYTTGWERAMVSVSDQTLSLTFESASADLVQAISSRLPEDFASDVPYQTEFNFKLAELMQGLAARLQTGYVVWIDYGYPAKHYYQQDRTMGTLTCYTQHHRHYQPLYLPGTQDITAHVDFTAVWQAAQQAGFLLAGFNTQARFILHANVEGLFREIDHPEAHYALANQLKQLIMPGQMGEAFKVMALAKGVEKPLLGFQDGDLRHTLT